MRRSFLPDPSCGRYNFRPACPRLARWPGSPGAWHERRNVLSERTIEIVELDRRMASDPDGVELKRLTERLAAGKGRVVQEMGRGVSTDEYARLSLLAQAYDAGIDALPKLWASINEDSNP